MRWRCVEQAREAVADESKRGRRNGVLMRHIHDAAIDDRVFSHGCGGPGYDIVKGLEREIEINGMSEICLDLTRGKAMDVVPTLPEPDGTDIPLDQPIVDLDVEPVATRDGRCGVCGTDEGGAHDLRDGFVLQIRGSRMCLEDAGRIQIESGEVTVDDVIWIAYLSMSNEQGGG